MSPDYAVEFLIWMMIAASVIALLAAKLRIPYTVALVLGGLALVSAHIPLLDAVLAERPEWMTPNIALVLFLPPLLFEGSLKLQTRHLRENLVPILLLASVGVLAATLITGFSIHSVIGLPLLPALVFGSIVAATDPISVLAIFRDLAVTKRLSVIVEGESLFNDGSAIAIFGILVAGVTTGSLSIAGGVRSFLVVALGGAALGLGLGYLASKITQRIDDPQIEITLTTILAYGTYLAAESMHLSGAIGTVAAGLMAGNLGAKIGMSPRTRVALWSFWEYLSFAINSIVFLLIGIQVHIFDLIAAWKATLLTIGAVLLGRLLVIYVLMPVAGLFTERIPLRWQHVMVWGGLRGALSLALALSLSMDFPYRSQILAMTFGVVGFTIVVQGLTIKPLLAILGITSTKDEEYRKARAQKMAISAARAELDAMLQEFLVSTPVYERLGAELDERMQEADSAISGIYTKDESRLRNEFETGRLRMRAAEKSAIEQALHEGLISSHAATSLISAVDARAEEDEKEEQSPEPAQSEKTD